MDKLPEGRSGVTEGPDEFLMRCKVALEHTEEKLEYAQKELRATLNQIYLTRLQVQYAIEELEFSPKTQHRTNKTDLSTERRPDPEKDGK